MASPMLRSKRSWAVGCLSNCEDRPEANKPVCRRAVAEAVRYFGLGLVAAPEPESEPAAPAGVDSSLPGTSPQKPQPGRQPQGWRPCSPPHPTRSRAAYCVTFGFRVLAFSGLGGRF